jgi:CxxH/CxxC protein (TIGR04129 family)
MIETCTEHLERGIEQFVDEQEEPPDVFKIDQLTEESGQGEETVNLNLTGQCQFCKTPSVYIVETMGVISGSND